MKVIVSGATGFVASHLIPALLAADHDVVAIGHDASRIPPATRSVVFDLSRHEWPTLPEADAIVHLAQANTPFPSGVDALFAVNVAATQRLLEHARRAGAQRFVLASSGSVYGASDGPLTEDSPLHARDFYAGTKVAAERLAIAYERDLDVSVVRLFVPYGPGQQRRMLPRLVERIATGQPVQLNRGARPRMNPIYVDDVVSLMLGAFDAPRGVGVMNAAGDDVADVRGISEAIGDILDVEPVFEANETDVADIVADNRRLHAFLGDTPLVPLRMGLERMVASLRG